MSISSAAYKVIEDIENYIRIGGMNKEISRLAAQIYVAILQPTNVYPNAASNGKRDRQHHRLLSIA
jgi:hypothetical protein